MSGAEAMHSCPRCRELTELATCPNCHHRADVAVGECDCDICLFMGSLAGGWLDALRRHEEAFATMTEPMDAGVYERAARASQALPSLSDRLPLDRYNAVFSLCARIATQAAADFTYDEDRRRPLVHFLIRMLLMGFGIGHEVAADGPLTGEHE